MANDTYLKANIPYLTAVFEHFSRLGAEKVDIRSRSSSPYSPEYFVFVEAPLIPTGNIQDYRATRELLQLQGHGTNRDIAPETCSLTMTLEDMAQLILIGAWKRVMNQPGCIQFAEPVSVQETLARLKGNTPNP